jgi:hypothetical protein
MTTIDDFISQAMSLPSEARLDLTLRLWETVRDDYEPSDDLQAFVAKRIAAFYAGDQATIPADDAMNQAREMLAKRRLS